MATVRYRFSVPEDRDAILEVLGAEKTAAQRRAREASFDWQYGRANPHDDGGSPFLVVTVDEQIAGVNGRMPVRVRYRGEAMRASWSCDLAVAPGFRHRGFGKALCARLPGEGEVALVYGISDQSDPIFEQLGWALASDLHCLFFSVAEAGVKGRLKNARSALMRRALGRRGAGVFDVVRYEGEGFGAEVDALWDACVSGYESVIERDAAYLNWRYRDHPGLAYVAYHARRAGQLRGVLVVRPDALESVIADYCGPVGDAELKRALVEPAVADLCRSGTTRIRCETTDPELLAVLERAGFRRTKWRCRFRVWSRREADRGRAEGWFLMTGDSDNDLGAIASPCRVAP